MISARRFQGTAALRWSALGLVALLVVGGGTAYAMASGDSVPRYRTVVAAIGDVEQTLSSSGTVDAAHRADLGFGTDGTIASLRVAVGDRVAAGQVLAALDTGDLDAAVTEAKAGVARAVARLATDRSAQRSSVQDAVSEPSGGSGLPSGGSDDSVATAATLKALKKLQDEVIAAQSAASSALDAARSALTAQTSTCAGAYATPAADPGSEDADPPAESADDVADDACAAALAEVQARQQAVGDAQGALAAALDDLAGALTKALGGVGASGTPPASSARTSATSPSGSDSPTSGGATVTAAQLASDQAQIDQAQADLVSAEQDRAAATLRSTRSGRVAALTAGKGDAVSGGATVATIVGGRAVTVTGTVDEDRVDQIELGQEVRVTAPGAPDAADGKVTAIGLVADSSSGSTRYPVTVTVEDPAIALPTGSTALLEIVMSTANDVVTVPTSAITRRGDTTIVKVWDGHELATEQVTLGASSTRTVEISTGLRAGEEVVLAAIDDPIDGASSQLNNRGGFAPAAEFRGGGPGGAPVTFTSAP